MIRFLMGGLQAAGLESVQAQELWQPPVPSHHLVIVPEALQQPRDGYKGLRFPSPLRSRSLSTSPWPLSLSRPVAVASGATLLHCICCRPLPVFAQA